MKKLKTIIPQEPESQEEEEEEEEEEEDILTHLPQPILHHILSFLDDIKYTIRISILSKTWKTISTTSPYLDFNFETYGGISKRRHPYVLCWFTVFLEFVNKVLTTHYPDSSTAIQRFHLKCGNECVISSSHVKKWIGIVIKRGVQDLSVEFLSDRVVLDLPSEFFNCRSLVNLKLLVLKYDGLPPVLPLFNLPDSGTSFVNLRTLHLQLVCFDGGFMQKVFTCCPVLGTLVMRNCGVHEVDGVVISANQLKYLEIDGFYAYVEQRIKNNCKIMITTPNVESFFCRGDVANDVYIENLSSLVDGEIELATPLAGHEAYWMVIDAAKKKYAMMKFFGGLSNAKSLTLCSLSLEIIGQASGISPTVFSGLQQLQLNTSLPYYSDCILGIKHILENSCNLDTLIMRMTWEPYSELRHKYPAAFNKSAAKIDSISKPDSWAAGWDTLYELESVADQLAKCNFSHLKFAEVWTTVGCGNDLEFIRMLLKNAIALEKLTIVNSKGHPNCSERQLMEFGTKVLAFQRASSNVEILFSQA